MERKLCTKRGERLYRRRAASIGPVWGRLRQRGMGRFRRRGLKACTCEWCFEHAVHNLLKIRTSGKWAARATATPRVTSRALADLSGVQLSPASLNGFLRQPLK